MTTQEIANRLVELCRQGNYNAAQEELYAADAVSEEPVHAQGLQTVHGIEAIKAKGAQFQGMIETVHSAYVSDAVVAGNRFAIAQGMDITMKEMGRMDMQEIAVYEVKEGKIVKELFIY
jgi:hypothetical protein